jgi:hypothetical protein
MTFKTTTTNRPREKDEVHLEAIASDGSVPHLDETGNILVTILVTMEHVVAASIAMKSIGTLLHK